MPTTATFQAAALGLFPPPLAAPVIAEQFFAGFGDELEQALLPLLVYCQRQEARPDLSDAQADHVERIRDALQAVATYGGQADTLLDRYRAALTAAQQAMATQVPSLANALRPDWEAITMRAFERLEPYLPPRQPSELEQRMQRFIYQPHLQARLALPLDHRRALAGITSHDLTPPDVSAHG